MPQRYDHTWHQLEAADERAWLDQWARATAADERSLGDLASKPGFEAEPAMSALAV